MCCLSRTILIFCLVSSVHGAMLYWLMSQGEGDNMPRSEIMLVSIDWQSDKEKLSAGNRLSPYLASQMPTKSSVEKRAGRQKERGFSEKKDPFFAERNIGNESQQVLYPQETSRKKQKDSVFSQWGQNVGEKQALDEKNASDADGKGILASQKDARAAGLNELGRQAERAAPSILSRKKPDYPVSSRRLGEEGTVEIAVLINADGKIEQASILKSSGYDKLDKEAIKVIYSWRFLPAKQAGISVRSTLVVPVIFDLSKN